MRMTENDAAGVETPDSGAMSWEERESAQAAAYDAIGDRYDEAFPHKDGQIGMVERLLPDLPPGARVLDLGCGTGTPTTRQLVDGGCRVTGTDISPRMLEVAKRNVPEARFLLRDMVDLDPERETYDAVVSCFSLLHLTRDRIPVVLDLVRRALVPGGRFGLAMVEADVDDAPIPFLGQTLRVTGYFRDELRGMLHSAGFTVEHERTLSYAPASTQARPEIQIFMICGNGEERGTA
ncbi:methyltransferase family protein [Haloactinospora alba]|uniref:Methyltransferase family protein n=2 Tax=Haloactinospora alba TaxID=405555 RepID=A0A543N9J1_9ACTN|nr:methyltransferase family protein [Haloactinospora alba]